MLLLWSGGIATGKQTINSFCMKKENRQQRTALLKKNTKKPNKTLVGCRGQYWEIQTTAWSRNRYKCVPNLNTRSLLVTAMDRQGLSHQRKELDLNIRVAWDRADSGAASLRQARKGLTAEGLTKFWTEHLSSKTVELWPSIHPSAAIPHLSYRQISQ